MQYIGLTLSGLKSGNQQGHSAETAIFEPNRDYLKQEDEYMASTE